MIDPAVAPQATSDRPAFGVSEVVDHDPVTATVGTFTGSRPLTYAHRWEICHHNPTLDCQRVVGTWYSEDGDNPRVGEVDAALYGPGSSLRLVVTATNAAGSASMTSDELPVRPLGWIIRDNPLRSFTQNLPGLAGDQFIEGNVAYGGLLLAANNPTHPYSVAGSYLRCADTTLESCTPIAGTESADFDDLRRTITAADVGSYLRVKKSVTNPAGTVTGYTAPRLVPHSPPHWTDWVASASEDGFQGHWTGLAFKKGPRNTDSGFWSFQVHDQVSWHPGRWIGDTPMTADADVVVEWRSSDGQLLHTGQTWTIDRKLSAGTTLIVKESRSNATGTTSHEFNTGQSIQPATVVAPTNLTAPRIVGRPAPREGELLDVNHGTWNDGDGELEFSVSWQRCDPDGSNCTSATLQQGPGYRPTLDDSGKMLRARVTASNSAGSATVTTGPTQPVWIRPYRFAVADDIDAAVSATHIPAIAHPAFFPAIGIPGDIGIFGTPEQWTIEVVATGLQPPSLGGDAEHDDPMLIYVDEDQLIGRQAHGEPGLGAGFGVRNDGCLYGSFGYDREFALNYCVSALESSATRHHLAMTYDGADARFYVDGVQTAVQAIQSPRPGVEPDPEHAPADQKLPVSLGKRPRAGWGDPICSGVPQHCEAAWYTQSTNVFTGTVRDAAFYSISLAAARIQLHSDLLAQDRDPAIPANTTAPIVSGTELDGRELTATHGEWTGTAPLSYAYQWQRCATDGSGCEDIAQATLGTYRLASDDIDHAVRVVVTATNPDGEVSAPSAPTGPIGAGSPLNTSLPVVTGSTVDGAQLAASRGGWAGTAPLTYAYQWRRCDESGDACVDIDAATSATYSSTHGDVGHTIRVVVSAENGEGTSAATSAATDLVAEAFPTATAPPTISGPAKVGETLSSTTGTWTGTPTIALARQWLRCDADGGDCHAIDDATDETYTPSVGDAGGHLRVRVTATNAAGTRTAESEPTDVVTRKPASTTAPAITGSAQDGRRLTAVAGIWVGTTPIQTAVRWQRCDDEGAGCTDIDGATSRTYVVTSADVGHALRVVETASNVAGEASRASSVTDAVEPAPPANAVVPKIGGIAQLGGHLQVHTGTWKATPPVTYSYQWRLCDAAGADCSDIDGATVSTLDVETQHLGHTLRAVVTAANAAGSASVTTPATKPVATFSAAIVGEPLEKQVLEAAPGDLIADDPPLFTYQWQSCAPNGDQCQDIDDATRRTYALGAGDVGTTLRVTISAVAGSLTAIARSAATATVANPVPVNRTAPVVLGQAAQGHTLTVLDGTWGPAGTVSYHWERCDSTAATCVQIAGATTDTYAVGAADIGSRLRASVTSTTSGGAATAPSEPSTVVPMPTLLNTSAPSVTRHSGVDGETLTAGAGDWVGTEPIDYRYQWQRCRVDGTACASVESATEPDYVPGSPDVGHALRVLVTASNPDGSDSARSAASTPISASVPTSASAPSLSGQSTARAYLWADRGTWWGTGPMRFEYQWQRCDIGGGSCEDVEGQVDSTYQQGADDIGRTLRVRVTASNPVGDEPVLSPASATVTATPPSSPAPPVNSAPPVISGDPEVGETLELDRGEWQSSDPITYSYEWERCDAPGSGCVPIADAADRTYVATEDDVQSIIRAIVVATSGDRSAVATASTLRSVRTVDAPVNDQRPELSGTLREGEQLVATTGTWSGPEADFTYEWQRCRPGDDACDVIANENDSTYQLRRRDVGWQVQVLVIASAGDEQSTLAASDRSAAVAPSAPLGIDTPSISGAREVGATLHADHGTWAGVASIAYDFQWQSCDPAGEDCADLPGAKQPDYELGAGDQGSTLRVKVTASNAHGASEATSSPHGPIDSAGGPVVTSPATLSAGAFADREIVVGHGTWEGTGALSFSYGWQSCDAAGMHCVTIADATSDRYTPTADDVGTTVRAVVTAHDAIGASTVVTDASLTVQPGPAGDAPTGKLVNADSPQITGQLRHGATVTADPGEWTGATVVSFAYQWRSCDANGRRCAAIEGATNASYSIGAGQVDHRLRVSVTASDGWATHTAVSEPTAPVAEAMPTNTYLPTLSGDLIDGGTLTADDGTWLGNDLGFVRQWQRCDTAGHGCEDIADATHRDLTLTPADVGHTLRFTVNAANGLGAANAASAPTSVVAPVAPGNAYAPQVYGVAMKDGVLTAAAGSWSGTPDLAFTYQWQSCDQDGENCADLVGATGSTYSLGAGDVGTRIRVDVTATNAAGQSGATSDPTDTVAQASVPMLVDGLPTIDGHPHDGQQLTASPGPWYGVDPMTYAYQWMRCDVNGDACADIGGAADQTYTPGAADLGSTMRVLVTATNPTGTDSARSEATAVIATAPPSNTGAPYASGDWRPGQEVTVSDSGQWSGTMPITYAYQWRRCDRYNTDDCQDIPDATSATYTLTASDSRHAVRVLVIASNAHGSETAGSYAAYVSPSRPQNTNLPTITGTPRVGTELTAGSGVWSPAADDYRYQWRACEPDGTSCEDVPWERSIHFRPGFAQAGKTIRVVVAGQNTGDANPPSATSEPTTVVGTTSPYNVAGPAMSTTTPVVDQPLAAMRGTWTGEEPLTYSYQWQYCMPSWTTCGNAFGGTGETYTPASYDVGYQLRVQVTVTNAYGAQSTYSERSQPVAEGPPHNIVAPTVAGTAIVGSHFDVDPGEWSGANEWEIQWIRCDASGVACQDLEGERGQYRIKRADLGGTLRARLTGKSSVGQETVRTEPSEVVTAATRPSNDVRPTITGTAAIGETLSADVGSWSGTPDIDYAYQWQRCDADGDPCERVDAADTPYSYVPHRADAGSTVRVSITATNGDGSVTTRSAPTAVVPDPVPLANVYRPYAGGTVWDPVRFGSRILGTGRGTWSGEPDLADQWQRCDPLTADPASGAMDCTDITGATNAKDYTPSAADVGFKLRIRETATTPDDEQVVDSEPTPEPVDQWLADHGGSYTGVPVVGEPITGHHRAASDADLEITTRYVFRRVEDDGSTTTLHDGPDASYTLTNAEIGHRVQVDMTASVWRADHATVVETTLIRVDVPEVKSPLDNVAVPAITGDARVGVTLTATDGDWSGGAGAREYAYQWQRCDNDGHDCADIADAGEASYRLAAPDLGHTVRVVVTASTGSAHASATSAVSSSIAAADAPTNTTAPRFTGDAVQRATLTADPGQWSGSAPISYTYQWQRCDDGGTGCADIPDASAATYVVREGDVDSVLRVAVTATNAAGSATEPSASSAIVAPPPPPKSADTPGLAILGPAAPGSTIVTDGGRWENVDVSDLSYQWQRCDADSGPCEDIEDADASSYDITDDDVGSRLQAVVSATNVSGTARVDSERSGGIGAQVTTAEDQIVYLDEDRTAMYLSARDGSEVRQVTDCAALTGHANCVLRRPRIAPDLAIIAVEDRPDGAASGSGDVYVVNVDGTNPRRLVAGGDPAWDPEGTDLLVTVPAPNGAGTRIARVRADGGDQDDPKELVSAAGTQATPDMSPDGTRLTFAGSGSGGDSMGIYVADADGSNVRRLTLDPAIANASTPRFTSDGTAIVFLATSKARANDLSGDVVQLPWSIRPDGSQLHRLTPDASERYDPPTVTPDEIITTRQNVIILDFGPGHSLGFGLKRVVSIPIDGGKPRPLGLPTGATDPGPAPARRARKPRGKNGHQAFLNFIKKYQPIIHGDPDDGFLPQPFPTVLRYRDYGRDGGPNSTCLVPKTTVPDSSGPCSRVSSRTLTRAGSPDQYLDYPANFEIENQKNLASELQHDSSNKYDLGHTRVYFHVVRSAEGGHIKIQYWFFYSYNYFAVRQKFGVGPVAHTFRAYADLHEGDWEHVTVYFDGDKLSTAKPFQVFYSAHSDASRTAAWGTGSDFKKGLDDGLGQPTHVRTYPAFGSHANLPYCGDGFATDVRITFKGLTKTINDHVCKDNKVENAYTIRAEQAALDNLDTHEWACWPGIAGAPNEHDASPGDDPIIRNLPIPPGVPRMPLTAGQQKGEPAPRCARSAHSPASAAAVDSKGQTLETTDVSDASFEELARCSSYERPGDTPGLTVVACDPDRLRSSVFGEGARTPLAALRSSGGEVQSAFPLVVTGLDPATAPVLERLDGETSMRIYTARTPDDGGAVTEVRFPAVALPAGARLHVDTTDNARWKLVDGAGRTLAATRPHARARATLRPRIAKLSWSWGESMAQARLVVRSGAGGRVYVESAGGAGWVRRLGAPVAVRDGRRQTLRVRLPRATRRVRVVARNGAGIVRSSWRRVP